MTRMPVAGLADLGEDVARDEDGVLAAELPHELAHLDDLHRIEPRDRLVEHDELRLVDDRLSDADALLEAVRQRRDGIVVTSLSAVSSSTAPTRRATSFDATPRSRAANARYSPDAHVAVERRDVREVADALAHRVRPLDDVDAVDADRAGRRAADRRRGCEAPSSCRRRSRPRSPTISPWSISTETGPSARASP